MSSTTDGSNGRDPHDPINPYPQLINVPPDHLVLVVPFDEVRGFLAGLAHDYLYNPSDLHSFYLRVRAAYDAVESVSAKVST